MKRFIQSRFPFHKFPNPEWCNWFVGFVGRKILYQMIKDHYANAPLTKEQLDEINIGSARRTYKGD